MAGSFLDGATGLPEDSGTIAVSTVAVIRRDHP